ncbi:MAG TPA: CoA transferase, partial [Mycobacteriales bacterium]|nr:CoA transferase [Mycobacteriales bacterium]
MGAAYEGVRILDASRDRAGAMAAMYLADHGADVVHVLATGTDVLGRDPGYLCWDRNKRLTVLDRSTDAGRAEIRRLALAADVAVFDGTGPELERDGLDARTLRSTRPDLIHLWMPMHAPAGPFSDLPDDQLLADAASSASGEHGSYDDHPIALVTPLVSYAHAALGASTAAAALFARRRTGQGRAVTATGLHAAVAMQTSVLTDAPGILRPRQTGGGSVASFRLYQCKDGSWLYLAALTQPLFVQALEALDLVEVLVLPGVGGDMLNLLRPEVGGPVQARIRDRFLQRPRDEWIEVLTAAGVPNAPALTRSEWWDSDVIASNSIRMQVEHDQLGTVQLPGHPLRFSRTPSVFSHLPGPQALVDAGDIWTDRVPADAEPAAAPTRDPQQGPLAGVRVLDLGAFMAGPFASTLFTDFGADVVKVEGPDGDPFRAFSISFLAVHKGQRDIVLDVKDEQARQVFYDLVRDADVLLDNVRPGVRERIGTDYASVAAVNPALVRGTLTAWGEDNPLSDTPAFDPLLQARSGLLVAQGGDAAPGTSSMMVHDIGSGLLMAYGLLVALYARERDGLGQEVVSSMANSSIMEQCGEFVQYNGRPAPRAGGHDYVGDGAAHRLYPCRDGWIAIAATTHQQAAALADAFQFVGLEPETLLAAPAAGEIADRIGAAVAGRTKHAAVDALAAAGVPAVPVLPAGAFRTDPTMVANRMFATVEDP